MNVHIVKTNLTFNEFNYKLKQEPMVPNTEVQVRVKVKTVGAKLQIDKENNSKVFFFTCAFLIDSEDFILDIELEALIDIETSSDISSNLSEQELLIILRICVPELDKIINIEINEFLLKTKTVPNENARFFKTENCFKLS